MLGGEINYVVEVFRSSTTLTRRHWWIGRHRADIGNCRLLRWQFARGKKQTVCREATPANRRHFSAAFGRNRPLRWIVAHQLAASLAYLG
jgi:hypothetical protein